MQRSAVVLPFSSMSKMFRPPMMEVDIDPIYPERRLWVAILIETFQEYEHWLQRISCSWRNSAGSPVCVSWQDHINKIKRECTDSWFDRICDLAGVDGNDARARFDVLDKKYKLYQVAFTDEPVSVTTRYFIRKAASRTTIIHE